MSFNAKMPNAADFFGADGKLSSAGVRYLGNLEGTAKKLNELAQSDAFDDELSGQFKYPEDGTEIIVADAKYARSIAEITAYSLAGTITLTWKINGTELGGGANSVTTSTATVSHDSDNQMEVGDTLTCELSDTSSDCVGVGWTIKQERAVLP